MRVLAFWATILAVLLACAGLVFALVGFINGNNIGMGVFGALLIVVPVGAAFWLTLKANAEGKPAFEAALANGFRADDRRWYQASGIAVDKTGGKVLLGEAKSLRTVRAISVSEVSYVPLRFAPAYSTGIMAIVGVFGQIGAAMHNFSQAGLFVAADGQRTRIIGVGQGDSEKWKALIETAKASA